MSARCTRSIRVCKDHPALAGHFPGNPVVPGVLLLERLLEAAEEQFGHRLHVAGLAHVKFTAPLLPEEAGRVSFEVHGLQLDFEVKHEDRLIARGTFRLATTGGE